MSIYVYLDQNILSYLRTRKLDKSENTTLRELRNSLKEESVQLLYSSVTLNEINQIGDKSYKDEHIDLLDELNAIHIEPQLGLQKYDFNNSPPSSIWKSFIENDIENDAMGINIVESGFEKLSKKAFGVETRDTFDDIGKSILDTTTTMLMDSLNDLKKERLPDGYNKLLENYISAFKDVFSDSEVFNIPEDVPLGPDPVRKIFSDKKIDLTKLSPIEVLPKIHEILLPEDEHKAALIKFAEGNIEDKISFCYDLMNLAGYYPDDFTRKKKHGDRFKASTNDKLHVRNAACCHFLISRDEKLKRKASACYAFLNILTEVVSPEEFLEHLHKLKL